MAVAMPRRSRITLADVAELGNLTAAFAAAARGKGTTRAVLAFSADLWPRLHALRDDLVAGRAPAGEMTTFRIFDPKPRTIRAPAFPDRVAHHALMRLAGPVLDRSLVDDTFACRTGKGTLAAVQRAQRHARRYPWFGTLDIRSYFASVDHGRLKALLARRFSRGCLLALFDRVIDGFAEAPGRGLPIGSLTSQYFANSYLGALDRHLLEGLRVAGMVRYMDDVVWWCRTKAEALAALRSAESFVADELRLTARDGYVQRSAHGLAFLGFRVLPHRLLLSPRRKRRYRQGCARWEAAFEAGLIDALALQRGYDAVLATTQHADAVAWRRSELTRFGSVDA